MAYRVVLTPAAERQLRALRGVSFVAVSGVILALASDPRPTGAMKLRGIRDVWRLRLRIDGRPWRVIYQLDDARRQVLITRVVPRDEGTYRGL